MNKEIKLISCCDIGRWIKIIEAAGTFKKEEELAVLKMTHFLLLDTAKRENKACGGCLSYHLSTLKEIISEDKKDEKMWNFFMGNSENPNLCCAKLKVLTDEIFKNKGKRDESEQLKSLQTTVIIGWIKQNKELIKNCQNCKKGSEGFLRKAGNIPFESNCTECKEYKTIIPILHIYLDKNKSVHYRDFCLNCLKKYRDEIAPKQKGDSKILSYFNEQIKILEENI